MSQAWELDSFTYAEWLEFVFDHPADAELYKGAADPPTSLSWHDEPEWSYTCSSKSSIERMSELFQRSLELPTRFTLAQINQGFWFIPGPNGFMWSLLDAKVEVGLRVACVLAIESLFNDLYRKFPASQIGASGYMWWDSVVTYCAYQGRAVDDDLDILQAASSVIASLAHSPCEDVQRSALHGVLHLRSVAQSTRKRAAKIAIEQALSGLPANP